MRSLVFLFILLASVSSAAEFKYTWTPPEIDATHDVAVAYIVQTSEDDINWAVADTVVFPEWTATLEPGDLLYVRVAGISSQGFAGPWSGTSPLLDFRPPNQPGQPTWLQVVLGTIALLALALIGNVFRRNN